MLVFNPEKRLDLPKSIRYLVHDNLYVDLYKDSYNIKITKKEDIFLSKVVEFYINFERMSDFLQRWEDAYDDYLKFYVFVGRRGELALTEKESEIVYDTILIATGEIADMNREREIEELDNCIRHKITNKTDFEHHNFEQIVADFDENNIESVEFYGARLQRNMDSKRNLADEGVGLLRKSFTG